MIGLCTMVEIMVGLDRTRYTRKDSSNEMPNGTGEAVESASQIEVSRGVCY